MLWAPHERRHIVLVQYKIVPKNRERSCFELIAFGSSKRYDCSVCVRWSWVSGHTDHAV